jgi:hypothetical protein
MCATLVPGNRFRSAQSALGKETRELKAELET